MYATKPVFTERCDLNNEKSQKIKKIQPFGFMIIRRKELIG